MKHLNLFSFLFMSSCFIYSLIESNQLKININNQKEYNNILQDSISNLNEELFYLDIKNNMNIDALKRYEEMFMGDVNPTIE
tara:strand:+ start:64 stop:309 length:246 start_codon:yes stop_codon:yes gene_type:complete